jgi:hypothetical protein
MAGSAQPPPGSREPGFGREATALIRRLWSEGEKPVCPECATPLAPQPVPPRPDVSYVRDRVLLVCPDCRRSAPVERKDRKGPLTEGSTLARLPLVGWREWVTLASPEGGPFRVKAKVDTGARTSALHAEGVERFERHGALWLRFVVHPRQKSRTGERILEAPLVDRRSVRSSSGQSEERPVVRLSMGVGLHRFEAEVTLTRRDSMGFRMLLGRTALRGRFLVAPGASYLQRLPASESPPPDEGSPSPDPSPSSPPSEGTTP